MSVAERTQLRADLLAWNAGIQRARRQYYADLQVMEEGYCASGDGRKLNRSNQRLCQQCYAGKGSK